MLFGDSTAVFAIEVALRLVVCYAVLVVSLRVMGRRVASQLTRNELIAIVSLAAAVGPAVATPDAGLLPPIVVAIWVVCLQRLMAWGSFESPAFEHWMQGEPATLVADGRIDLAALRRNALSRDLLYAALRNEGLKSLGSIERVYLEPDGRFTVVSNTTQRPGLTLVPDWDSELSAEQRRSARWSACAACGQLVEKRLLETQAPETNSEAQRCPCCRETTWTDAVEN
jgi:uncharacterized membrane protein YcaP (DUF421 family)